MSLGGTQSTQRETWEEHENSTQTDPGLIVDLNSAVLINVPPCCLKKYDYIGKLMGRN